MNPNVVDPPPGLLDTCEVCGEALTDEGDCDNRDCPLNAAEPLECQCPGGEELGPCGCQASVYGGLED